MSTRTPTPNRIPVRSGPTGLSRLMPWVGFMVTFLMAWIALDRLVVSPPTPLNASACLIVAAVVLLIGEHVVYGGSTAEIRARLGFRRPAAGAMAAATLVGVLIIGVYDAAATAMDVELRSNWAAVALGALLFHGLAEELVWRGFAFAHLRRTTSFWKAMAWSVPLIALTHFPIVATNGWMLGALAVATAALTCLPFAYLWERSGGTVWAPAVLHGLQGTWQVFDRTYDAEFSLILLFASMTVPLTVFCLRGRFFGRPRHGSLIHLEGNQS